MGTTDVGHVGHEYDSLFVRQRIHIQQEKSALSEMLQEGVQRVSASADDIPTTGQKPEGRLGSARIISCRCATISFDGPGTPCSEA